jgi:hypothetical protein
LEQLIPNRQGEIEFSHDSADAGPKSWVDPLMRKPRRRFKAAVTTEQLGGAPPLPAAVVNQSLAQYSRHCNSNKQSHRRYAANGFAL